MKNAMLTHHTTQLHILSLWMALKVSVDVDIALGKKRKPVRPCHEFMKDFESGILPIELEIEVKAQPMMPRWLTHFR